MSNSEDSLHDTDDENFIAQYFTSDRKLPEFNNVGGCTVLKSTENILSKTSELKKKFKKYKLRKNHEDDIDILNVSQSLSSTLKVTSPSKLSDDFKFDKYLVKWRSNYLSKMAKKSSKSFKSDEKDSSRSISSETNNSNVKIENVNDCNEISNNSKKGNFFKNHDGEILADNISDNKPMNAFMLMMGARNKSLGSNSPGKERVEEASEDILAKRNLKVKRNLALETMALAKGSKNNEEIEAFRDKKIKVKMSQRAKRLKTMLINNEKKLKRNSIEDNSQKHSDVKNPIKKRFRTPESNTENSSKRLKTENSKSKIEINEVVVICSDEDESKEFVNEQADTQKLNKIIESNKCINPTLGSNRLSKSDLDFLNKLSPSMKKKESVLCYFDKIDRNVEDKEYSQESSENFIKVKFTPKRKQKLKKSKKLKQSNDENSENDNKKKDFVKDDNCTDEVQNKKYNKKISTDYSSEENVDFKVEQAKVTEGNLVQNGTVGNETDLTVDVIGKNERRSKRISKKPVKYSIECDFDNYEVLMPNKQKYLKKSSPKNLKLKKNILDLKSKSEERSNVSKEKNKKIAPKSKILEPSKLASIFTPKAQISKADLEAKQKFLHSGIPDQLKKNIEKHKSFEIENDCFIAVCHIQQKTVNSLSIDPWTLKHIELDMNCAIDNDLSVNIGTEKLNLKYEKFPFKTDESKFIDDKEKLHAMKKNYPKFPVYRIFKQLKSKCVSNMTLNVSDFNVELTSKETVENLFHTKFDDSKTSVWCDKFRPTDTSDIIGNFDGVNTLKQWLTNWKETNFDGKNERIRTKSNSSDSSDFYYPSDSDSRDDLNNFNNVLVLTGPPGCGKTTSVYAIANELAIKVIEVNTSSKRSGKVMLLNLQEATQSHKVSLGTTSTETSQNSQDQCSKKKIKKKNILKTYSKKQNHSINSSGNNSQVSDNQINKTESNKTGMSLILIEDADLVFEQDDGFISALTQIVQTSKRPVILITSSLNCPHLQKFIKTENVIKFHQLSPKMLGMWLDLMCVVENGGLRTNTGQNLLEIFEGDIRKSINILQFWIGSNKSNKKSDIDQNLPNNDSQDKQGIEDESSSFSWCDQEIRTIENKPENLNTVKVDDALLKTFISTYDHDIGIRSSVLQFPVNHLNIWWNIPDIFNIKKDSESDVSETKNKSRMLCYAKLIDSLTLSDVISSKIRPSEDVSAISNPWKSKLLDSVSEETNMSYFNKAVSLGDSLSYALLTSSISSAQHAFEVDSDNLSVNYTIPGLTQIRYKEKLSARHHALYDCLSVSSQLDRRSLATDYFPACREICRIEKDRCDSNTKRNNRFCHYLRSMKVNCSSETFELLSESLTSVE